MTVTRLGDDKSVVPEGAGGTTDGEGETATATAVAPDDSAAHDRPRRWDASGHGFPAYGALDLGTNNCRLLVARPSRRGFLVTDAFSRIIRLGEGLGATRCLSDAAMARTMDALRVCSMKLAKAHVVRSQLVATEACRVASNGRAFLDQVRRELGLRIEILNRKAEARLAVAGCAALLDPRADLALVFDIGGGSSELIWLDLSRRRQAWRHSLAERIEAQNCIAAWTSLPVGVVTLAERYGGRNVTAQDFEAMVAQVMHMLEPFEREYGFGAAMRRTRTHMLGTSGTVTTIAGIHMKLPRYDRNRVDGTWMQTTDVRAVVRGLLERDYEGRVAEPCIGRERADLVLAGCAILEALLRVWPCDRLRVADRGLREGILANLMAEDRLNGTAKPGSRR